jgi:hypothetical protein
MTNEITLKVDESNELKFKIKINGKMSEPDIETSARLLITEKGKTQSMGFVFPVIKMDEDSLLVFVVPSLLDLVKTEVAYEGKIEVIIGTRIFCPITIDIFFVRDMSVEVVPVKVKQEPKVKPEPKSEREDISNLLEELSAKPEKKSIMVTKSQLEAMIRERKEKMLSQQVHQKIPIKSASESFKNSFKDLMKSALTEDSKKN